VQGSRESRRACLAAIKERGATTGNEWTAQGDPLIPRLSFVLFGELDQKLRRRRLRLFPCVTIPPAWADSENCGSLVLVTLIIETISECRCASRGPAQRYDRPIGPRATYNVVDVSGISFCLAMQQRKELEVLCVIDSSRGSV
jgi:hypothetical protein